MLRNLGRAVARSYIRQTNNLSVSCYALPAAVKIPGFPISKGTSKYYSTPSNNVENVLEEFVSSKDPINVIEAELSPSELQRFKVIQLEFDVQESMGNTMPVMNEERWRYIIEKCTSWNKRYSLLST